MNKTVINRILIVLFLLICLIPSLGMLVFGESEASANEVLAKFPSFLDKSGKPDSAYLTKISDWASDRFAFRQEMITAWSGLNSTLFGTSVEDKVIIGKTGWLYYSETLNDYTGAGLEEAKLEAVARNLSLMQEYSESKGAKFLFTIAPNKNSIYPGHMPDYIPHGYAEGNAERLEPFIHKYDVKYADLFSALSEKDEILYFKTDSHWDSKGAALAADVILTGLGRESSFYPSVFIDGEEHTGDLYEMLFPAGKFTETDRKYAPGFSYTTAKDPNGGNAVNIESSAEEGTGSLICWRDSFGVSLYPYLAESFHDARFSRSVTYDLIRLEQEETDAVVIELVERNIGYLLEYMPLYLAPERDMPAVKDELPPLKISAEQGKTSASSGLVLLQCEIPEEYAENTREVFFLFSGRCYEAALLYPDGTGPVASAWVNASGYGNVSVVFGNGGEYYLSAAA